MRPTRVLPELAAFAAVLLFATSAEAQPADKETEPVEPAPQNETVTVDPSAEEGDGGDPSTQPIEDFSLAELLDLPIEGASKIAEKQSDSPTSTTVITADEIARYGYRTLPDILTSVRSFYVFGDRSYEYVGVRGLGIPGDYNSRVLVLINGHRVNDAIYDAVLVGQGFPVDMSLVERVEIIRGPSSSIYGTSAFCAVLNVVNTKGAAVDGVGARAEVGSLGSQTASLTYGKSYPMGVDVLMSAQAGTSEGDEHVYFPAYDDPRTFNGIVSGSDGEDFAKAFVAIEYQDVTLEGFYGGRRKDIPTASFYTIFGDDGEYILDQTMSANLKYHGQPAEALDVLARFSFNRTTYEGDYPMDYGTAKEPLRVVNRDESVGTWLGTELQVTHTFEDKYRLSAGLDWREVVDLVQKNFDAYGPGSDDNDVYLDSDDTARVVGLYLQANLTPLDWVTFDAGVRYDSFSIASPTNNLEDTDTRINPRVALIFRPFDRTLVKALYGTALRSPSAYERLYVYGAQEDGEAQLFNPALAPEHIDHYELSLQHMFDDSLRGMVSGYFYQITDLIVVETIDELDNYQYRNVSDINAVGFEAEVDGKWRNGLRGRLSYALQYAADVTETNQKLVNSPQHTGKLNLSAPITPNLLFFGGEVQVMSSRETPAGTAPAPAYALANVSLSGEKVWDELGFELSVKNITDHRFEDPASFDHRQNTLPRYGRLFWFALTYGY